MYTIYADKYTSCFLSQPAKTVANKRMRDYEEQYITENCEEQQLYMCLKNQVFYE